MEYDRIEEVTPLRNRVLIKLYPVPKEINVNGIIQPVDISVEKKHRIAEVLGVGVDVVGIDKGMKVVINRQFGARLNKPSMFDAEYRIMSSDQIEGILDDDIDPSQFWMSM